MCTIKDMNMFNKSEIPVNLGTAHLRLLFIKVQVSEGVRLFCPFGVVPGADSRLFQNIPNSGSSARNRVFHLMFQNIVR